MNDTYFNKLGYRTQPLDIVSHGISPSCSGRTNYCLVTLHSINIILEPPNWEEEKKKKEGEYSSDRLWSEYYFISMLFPYYHFPAVGPSDWYYFFILWYNTK